MRYVVLLRGVNVGGHNRLPMADLRASLEAAGFTRVVTYIQSGNVVLSGRSCKAATVTSLVRADFGYDVPAVVRTTKELRSAIDANPFTEAEAEPKKLHVYFCSGLPSSKAIKAFDADRFLPDRFASVGQQLYVAYDRGIGVSKLTNTVLDKAMGVSTTARNWNTVLKLAELASD